MIADGVEDEEKYLAAGIAGLQQNAFYMHRALVSLLSLSLSLAICITESLIDWIFNLSGLQQFEGRSQILRSDAIGASHFQAFPSQILRTLYSLLTDPILSFLDWFKFLFFLFMISSEWLPFYLGCLIAQICEHSMNWESWRCFSRRRLSVVAPPSSSMNSCSMLGTYCPGCKFEIIFKSFFLGLSFVKLDIYFQMLWWIHMYMHKYIIGSPFSWYTLLLQPFYTVPD